MNTEISPGNDKQGKSFITSSFASILITALLTAGIMFFVMKQPSSNLTGDVSEDETYFEAPTFLTSGPITKVDADSMIKYWNDHPLIKVRTEDDNGRTKQPLLAYRFSVANIDSIIHKNAALQPGETPDDIIIYIGRKADSVSGLKHFYQVHLIAMGVKNNKVLNYSIDNNKAPSIFDKADPCPPGKHCPTY